MKRISFAEIRTGIILAVCMAFSFFMAGALSVKGAVRQEDAVQYACTEGGWYQIKEDQQTEVTDSKGISKSIFISVSYTEEQRVEIREKRSYGYVYICKGSSLRGIYIMLYGEKIYFAAELWDDEGTAVTCLWREDDTSAVQISGTLLKKEGCIEIRDSLYGGYERHVTMDLENWSQEEEAVQSERNTYTLLRPLLLAQAAELQESSEICIIPAGTKVCFSDYKKDKSYEWYKINYGEDAGWLPIADGHMALQDTAFCDCFSSGSSDVHYVSPNKCWEQPEEEFCTFYAPKGAFRLCDYIDTINEQATLQMPYNTQITLGIFCLDRNSSDTFVALQYSKTVHDDMAVYSQHVCKLYRLVGGWLFPIDAEGYEDGELPVRLFREEVEGWSEGYTDEPVQVLEKDGTIWLEGQLYQLEGLNHLVKVERGE